MKWLFYLLALTNVSVLAVQYWYLPPPRPPATAQSSVSKTPDGMRPLVLVSELHKPPAKRELKEARTEPLPQEIRSKDGSQPKSAQNKEDPRIDSVPAILCYRIGDLGAESEADELATRLKRAGAEVRGRHQQMVDKDNYWVMLPPFPSAAAARRAIHRLGKGGIKDHYLITTGEHRLAVSLGVFSNRQGAERRRRQVRRLNFRPRIEILKRPAKVFALTVALPWDQKLSDSVTPAIAKIAQVPCP